MSVAEAAACPSVVAPGLDCLRGHADLAQILRFDRPVILVLGSGDSAAYAVLQGAGRSRVRLDVAGVPHEIDRDSLPRLWSGDFVALWRQPSDVPATLKRGDAGPGVAWVSQRLAALDGDAAAGSGPAYFDAALESRVRKLQQAYGIRADGIVGPETLFALSALDDQGPHLARTVE